MNFSKNINIFDVLSIDNEDQCYQYINPLGSMRSIISNNTAQDTLQSEDSEIMNFRSKMITFQNKESYMIMIKSITSIVKYEKVKVKGKFYEAMTATFSHEMRTPLNAIIGLL